MKYREVEKKLKKLGCIELKGNGGSHRKWINPSLGRGTSAGLGQQGFEDRHAPVPDMIQPPPVTNPAPASEITTNS
ncbi:hypothetical protein BH20ACI2_BH20ACI2_08710 [soil metagenome]